MTSSPMVDLGRGVVVPEARVRQQVERFRFGDGDWLKSWGPNPDQHGCRVPPHLLGNGEAPRSFSGGARVTFHLLRDVPPRPPREDIVAGLFQPGELVILVGAPKAGKSALAVHLTKAVASGEHFLGRETRRAAVAYLALERSDETVRRLEAAEAGDLPIFFSGDHPALSNEADLSAVIEALRATSAALRPDLPLGLIIVDTATKAFKGLRENDPDSISIGLEALRSVMRAVPTAAVVLIHHLTKDGSSARGSGAILADADLELTVTDKGKGRRTVEVTGANAVEEGQVLPFELVPVINDIGEPVIGVRDAAPMKALPGPAGGPKAAAHLPGGAAQAFAILAGMTAPTVTSWRDRMMDVWSDKRRGTAREAFSKARKILEQRGLVAVRGESVSVSEASADASASISADGAKASARASAHGPLYGGPADVADGADADAADAEL